MNLVVDTNRWPDRSGLDNTVAKGRLRWCIGSIHSTLWLIVYMYLYHCTGHCASPVHENALAMTELGQPMTTS